MKVLKAVEVCLVYHQARGGMRIGEVLKLMPAGIEGTRINLRNPKSGSEQEAVFIPKRVAGFSLHADCL
jgi:hypothetical protein